MQPHKTCHICGESKCKENYLGPDWNKKGETCCKACIKGMEEAGTPFVCYRCDEWKAGEKYSAYQLKRQRKRICVDCVGTETKPCSRCNKELMWRAFGNLWNEEADEKRLCV